MANLFDAHFTFNTSGSMHTKDNFKLFLDNSGNIIDKRQLEYGIYNKIIKIEYNKLFLIKLHKLGFGDIIDFITKILYIKKLVIYLTNGNCGCEQRRIKYNKFYIFWYSFKMRDLYVQDDDVVFKIKQLKKSKRKLKMFEESQEQPIPQPIPQPTQTSAVNAPTVPLQNPVTPVEFKKPCGCSKKR